MAGLFSRMQQWLRRGTPPLPISLAAVLPIAGLGRGAALDEPSASCGVAMYRYLAGSPDDIVVSPFSLRVALAMALGGARGDTATELRRLLGAGDDDPDVQEALGRLCRDLQAFGGDGSLGIANSLWIANAHPLTAEFEALASAHFASEIHAVNLASPATVTVMNRWVAARTFGRITGLISELNADSRLVLINALAFRGKWRTPFEPDETQDGLFTMAAGQCRLVPMMFQTMRVGYAEGHDAQAVDLEYQGGRLSMLIILPSAETGLSRLERQLAATLTSLSAALRVREVQVSIPRFKVSADQSPVPLLQSLGVRRCFDRGSADFSGVNGLRPPAPEALFISDILQRVVVDVSEQGTEAVAATAIMEDRAAERPLARSVIPEFRADRPFLFAIRDRQSGEILFMGRVTGSQFAESVFQEEADEFDYDFPEFFLRRTPRGQKHRGDTDHL